MWIQSANSHTGQQPELRKQAGQMAAIDPTSLKFLSLRFEGRPQMADVDAALEQQILHVPQRKREPRIHQHDQADDIRRGLK